MPNSNGFRDLAMQRQPTPRLDNINKNRMGHFLRRDDALRLFGDCPAALTNLDDLPSKTIAEAAEGKKARTGRDADITKKLKLKSWDGKKVRGITVCFNCSKP